MRERAHRIIHILNPDRCVRHLKGWERWACEPSLHYSRIHQNYSQTSLNR